MRRPRTHVVRADGAAVPAPRVSNGTLAWIVTVAICVIVFIAVEWAIGGAW